MKKLVVTFFIMLFAINFAFANKLEYEAELSKIRTIKNAQTSALNKQIKIINEHIIELEMNTTISGSEKEQKLRIYTKKLEKLTTKKQEISDKYRQDKAVLKKKYK